MHHWLLVVTLASGIMIPMYDFTSEKECLEALTIWDFDNGASGDCMQVSDEEVNRRKPLMRRKRK